MKQPITLICLLISFCSMAQEKNSDYGTDKLNQESKNLASVPKQVTAAFEKEHPGIDVAWEIEDARYEGSYTLNGEKNTDTFEENGTLYAHEIQIAFNNLPKRIKHYVVQNVAGSLPVYGKKIINQLGEVNYQVHAANQILVFDDKGNFIKTDRD